jgi:Cu+-exporting ATPase
MDKLNLESLKVDLLCYHCGAECEDEHIYKDDHHFCCEGCKLVYELLKENNLCNYYDLEHFPGVKRTDATQNQFSVLDIAEIRSKLIRFEDGDRARVILKADSMHCSSCIWLLEHLPRFNKGILSAEVNFPAREVTIDFKPSMVKLSAIAGVMASIGYSPSISLQDVTQTSGRKFDSRVIKIGVAGFCFANIMMLSFPEYLGATEINTQDGLLRYFSWLSLALSLPVLLYSGNSFFVSAWKSIKQRTLNIDAPIALAIAVTFGRSVYEIGFAGGAGYLDSMSGIIFFMLLGRYFQDRTYERLNFERDYKSYFPISVTVKSSNGEEQVPVTNLKKGDRIYIRAHELIPADSILLDNRVYVDYSFVTGESEPVRKIKGDKIYAGARQTGAAAEYEVLTAVSSGYLTQLWNNDTVGKRSREDRRTYIDAINKYFSAAVIGSSILAAIVWLFIDSTMSLNAMTSVLIVACPCTLLLASTFTNGSVLRWLGKRGFYVKSADALDRLAHADTIVFDKTGTITSDQSAVNYEGKPLSESELHSVLLLAGQSGHPLSRMLVAAYPGVRVKGQVTNVWEHPGKGIVGEVKGRSVLLGSSEFSGSHRSNKQSGVWVSINGEVRGQFTMRNKLRDGIQDVVGELGKSYTVELLSGDNNADEQKLQPVFGNRMYFGKSPVEKMEHISQLQKGGSKVIMIGDGLNDAGALMAAQGGIAVSDNTNNYFPACDAILDGKSMWQLPKLFSFVNTTRKIVYAAFIISVLYNFVGIFYAVTGQMSPLIAAILMPASTFSVVLFTTLSARIVSYLLFRSNK